MSTAAFNPDGSPNAALNAYRLRAIKARKDGGPGDEELQPARVLAATTGATCRPRSHDAIHRLCLAYLEPMRAKFGACTVLSGYRHRAYNRAIGGAIFSAAHLRRDAGRRSPPISASRRARRSSGRAYAKTLRAKYKKGGGIGTYEISNFVHVDNRTYNATGRDEPAEDRPELARASIEKGREKMSEQETPETEAAEPRSHRCPRPHRTRRRRQTTSERCGWPSSRTSPGPRSARR